VELLFVKVDKLPCKVPQPDTFNLPAPGAVGSGWCLGPGKDGERACFVVPHLPPGGTPKKDEWVRTPAEPGTFIVRGSIKFEDGTPAANVKYVLIAPDGEFMDGEATSGVRRGDGIFGKTKDDGTFEYPDKLKGIGVYTLEIQGQFVARLADEPPEAAKGNVVCKRLDGVSDFNVIIRIRRPGVHPAAIEFVASDNIENLVTNVRVGDTVRLRADIPDVVGDEIAVDVRSTPRIQRTSIFPPPTPLVSLAFVAADNIEDPVTSVRVGDTVRLRADAPDITDNEIAIQIRSFPSSR
jgi:hypothetical protein